MRFWLQPDYLAKFNDCVFCSGKKALLFVPVQQLDDMGAEPGEYRSCAVNAVRQKDTPGGMEGAVVSGYAGFCMVWHAAGLSAWRSYRCARKYAY